MAKGYRGVIHTFTVSRQDELSGILRIGVIDGFRYPLNEFDPFTLSYVIDSQGEMIIRRIYPHGLDTYQSLFVEFLLKKLEEDRTFVHSLQEESRKKLMDRAIHLHPKFREFLDNHPVEPVLFSTKKYTIMAEGLGWRSGYYDERTSGNRHSTRMIREI